MTKIIELAHLLGEEIAKSDEIKNLEAAKAEFETDEALQNKMHEYEAERMLLGQEFAKDVNDADQKAIADLQVLYVLERILALNLYMIKGHIAAVEEQVFRA